MKIQFVHLNSCLLNTPTFKKRSATFLQEIKGLKYRFAMEEGLHHNGICWTQIEVKSVLTTLWYYL